MKTSSNVTRKVESDNVVVFKGRSKNQKIPTQVLSSRQAKRSEKGDETVQSDKEGENMLSLKQAKFDVFKFGIKGFGKQQQEDAKAPLAIKLGAKVSSGGEFFIITG